MAKKNERARIAAIAAAVTEIRLSGQALDLRVMRLLGLWATLKDRRGADLELEYVETEMQNVVRELVNG